MTTRSWGHVVAVVLAGTVGCGGGGGAGATGGGSSSGGSSGSPSTSSSSSGSGGTGGASTSGRGTGVGSTGGTTSGGGSSSSGQDTDGCSPATQSWGVLECDAWWTAGAATFANEVVLAGMGSGNTTLHVEQRDATSGGVVQDFQSSTRIDARTLAADATTIYVGGRNLDQNSSWSVAAFSKADTTQTWLDTHASIYATNCGESPDAMALDGTDLYVVGTVSLADCSTGIYSDDRWWVEKRDIASGVMLWGVDFGGGSNAVDGATGVAVDSEAVYVAGTSGYSSTPFSLRKVSKTDGSLVWEVDASQNNGGSFVLDGADLYVFGLGTSTVTDGSCVQRRSAADGSLVWEQTLATTDRSTVALLDGNLYLVTQGQPVQQISKTDGSVVATGSTALAPTLDLLFSDPASLYFVTHDDSNAQSIGTLSQPW